MHWGKGTDIAARKGFRRWSEYAANLTGFVVVLWVLYPVFFHAFVWRAAPSPQVIAELRTGPDDSMLSTLAAERPIGTPLPEDGVALTLADRWLAASRAPDAAGQHPVVTEVSASDLVQGAGIGVLPFSSLYAADVNLRAFRATGDVIYLATARDLILAYARYERSAWIDPGFLWNDHAIAARVGVVIRFWAIYRAHPMFAPTVAAEILQHLSRSVALLAAPSHFTAWSNHGVMQNIALLQAAAAFPGLIDSAAISRLAVDRLTMQLRYYISDEGVVLEHSAGYHREGTLLLAQAVKLAELNHLPVPAQWREKLSPAESFLAHLRRPDGTLPAHGDTHVQIPLATDTPPAPFRELAQGEPAIYPLSGYAIWSGSNRTGDVTSHSFVAWSNFPDHAHKHADESELVVWADGRSWITPSGYAPYYSDLRARVEGWLGSNAPHGVGEASDLPRHSELLGSASSAMAVLLDVRRVATDGSGFRRQVVSLAGGRWLAIDQPLANAPGSTSETLWTFYPDLVIEPQSEHHYVLRDAQGKAMAVTLASGGGAPARASAHVASRDPFAGWVATDRGMTPAPALRVLSAPTGWTAAFFDLTSAGDGLDLRFTDGEHWSAAGQGWQLRRDGERVESSIGERQETMRVVVPPDTSKARSAIDASLAAAVKAYPRYRDVDEYRLRVAKILGGLWLLQVVLYLGARPALTRRGCAAASQVAVVLPWAAVAAWLGVVYFAM